MPLPAANIAIIKKAIADGEAKIKDIEPEINKAILAGIDVSDHQRQLTDLKGKVAKLKQQYGNL